jgi:hypothetical protein
MSGRDGGGGNSGGGGDSGGGGGGRQRDLIGLSDMQLPFETWHKVQPLIQPPGYVAGVYPVPANGKTAST